MADPNRNGGQIFAMYIYGISVTTRIYLRMYLLEVSMTNICSGYQVYKAVG